MPISRADIDAQSLPVIHNLIKQWGGDPETFDGKLVAQLIHSSLKLITDGHDTGQIKLITSALKEMRYAYRVFNQYRGIRKITIFGSARTPPEHPDYSTARDFSAAMAAHKWMAITGAGLGIMKAGHEGPQREASFGLSIRLPFETTANPVIEGDSKLITFRYFFTRKLMFMSHADAVAIFPGGFGTQDELFESLTLVQTGKSNIVPIIMLEGAGGTYWKSWSEYVRSNLLTTGFISAEDPGIFHIATSVDDAVEHVLQFYRVYHSSRYVGPNLVLRLKRQLTDAETTTLNDEFASLVKGGRIEQTAALESETDHLDLPRIVFEHSRSHFGRLRALIDRINGFGMPAQSDAPADGTVRPVAAKRAARSVRT